MYTLKLSYIGVYTLAQKLLHDIYLCILDEFIFYSTAYQKMKESQAKYDKLFLAGF